MNDKAKAVAGGIVAMISALSLGVEDGQLSGSDLGAVAEAASVAFGLVWLVPNSVISFAKALAGAAGAGYAAWVGAGLDGSVSGNDWYAILVALIGGIAVYWTKNEPSTRPA
jgi:hypothetical protein